MDVSRSTNSSVIRTLVEPTGKPAAVAREQAQSGSRTAAARELGLESLQALPDVDMERVQALRQALQEGRLNTDPAALAADMLAYHRGRDR